MRNPRKGILSEILLQKANITEIFIIAIIIAMGVNLVANSLGTYYETSPLTTLVLGMILILASVVYLLARILSGSTHSHEYEGFFIYDEKLNKTLDIHRYNFSEELGRYLRAAFHENKALETVWKKEPLKRGKAFITTAGERKEKSKRSHQLICEAVEYFVLSQLSTHLTDYFNDEKFRRENLEEFERNDIPDVLLKNRFMELFSRPMEERPSFVKDELRRKKEEGIGEVVAAFKGGTFFSKFSLVLPKESRIRRLEEGKIEIDTGRFTITIVIRFEGFNTSLPVNFEEYYLSLQRYWERYCVYQVNVDFAVHFKFGRLMTKTDWRYYQWVDSFLNKFDRLFSKTMFFKSIGWNVALTVMNCMKTPSNVELREESGKKRKE